jgi:hypothetical protein
VRVGTAQCGSRAENRIYDVVIAMHPSTKRAYEILDRLADFEVTPRDPAAVDALESWDALRARSAPTKQHHSGSSELIYKTHNPHQPVQQRAATMDEQTQARWDNWCKSHITRALEEFAESGDEIFSLVAQDIAALRAEMQGQIDQLRSELALLRGQIDGSVTTMRGRHGDDAA